MKHLFKKKEESKEESIITPHHSKKKIFLWQLISSVLLVALIITIVMFVANKSVTNNSSINSTVDNQVVNNTVSFIEENLTTSKVTISDTKIVDGFYEITLSIDGKDIPVYSTLSGDNIFLQAPLNKVDFLKEKANAAKPVEVLKSDKPKVEVFVMSHCPYGTQVEKGLIPVIETLNNKADIEIKFVDYAMHGKTELDEELNQYCIKTEEPNNYIPYLKCFLEDGNTSRCLAKVNIDKTKVNACVTTTDNEYKVTELFNDKSTWQGGSFPQFNIYKEENTLYGVQGSPTTVINGVKVENMPRDSAGILNQICLAFNDQPEECQIKLSSTAPSPGFGYGTGTNSTASCS